MFRNFDDEEVEVVVVVYVDDILAQAQATRERFAAELGGKFKVKSLVEKFGVEKASRKPASLRGYQPSLKADEQQTPEGGRYVGVPVPGGSGSAYVDGNNDTAGHCARGTRCSQVLGKPWTGALQKGDDIGHTNTCYTRTSGG